MKNIKDNKKYVLLFYYDEYIIEETISFENIYIGFLNSIETSDDILKVMMEEQEYIKDSLINSSLEEASNKLFDKLKSFDKDIKCSVSCKSSSWLTYRYEDAGFKLIEVK